MLLALNTFQYLQSVDVRFLDPRLEWVHKVSTQGMWKSDSENRVYCSDSILCGYLTQAFCESWVLTEQ